MQDKSTIASGENLSPEEPASAQDLLEPERVIATAAILQRTGRTIESRVVGSSMGSTIPEGSIIKISCGLLERPPVGQVVAVLAGPTGVFAHRVVANGVGRGAGTCVTQGDAATICDAPIPNRLVLGVVTAVKIETAWAPVPPMAPGPVSRIIRFMVRSTVAVALSIDVRVARSLVAFLMAVVRLFTRIERGLRRRIR